MKNNKNIIIYLTVATLAFWGGLQSISEMQAIPNNANAIVGAALALFEVGWFRFCWPDRKSNPVGWLFGGILILFSLFYGLLSGNPPLTFVALPLFAAGLWVNWWLS